MPTNQAPVHDQFPSMTLRRLASDISLYAITYISLSYPKLHISSTNPYIHPHSKGGSKETTDAMAETIEMISDENITFMKRLKQ